MKKQFKYVFAALISTLIVVAICSSTSGPYLSCDPLPATYYGNPVSFILKFDDSPSFEVPATQSQTTPNSVVIMYPLSEIPEGTHIVVGWTVAGVYKSVASNAFTFKKVIPAIPEEVQLSVEEE